MAFDEIEIWKTLQRIATLIGLHPDHVPSGDDKKLLLEYILECYGEYSTDEIERAFKFALSEKFPANTNCYGDFSCKFFSDIMNGYRNWKKKNQPEQIKPRRLVYAQNKIQDISDNEMENWIEQLKESLRRNKNYSVHFMSASLHDWMAEKRIFDGINLATQEAIQLRRNILFQNFSDNPSVENKNRFDAFVKMQNASDFSDQEENTLLVLAKKIRLLRWLQGAVFVEHKMDENPSAGV